MQGKDYSLPMWVETDISKFVSGRLHYCNDALLPSPPANPLTAWCRSVISPELQRLDVGDLSNNISVTLGKSTIRQTIDVWKAYLDANHIHPSSCIDEEPFLAADGELTIEFTGMPLSDGIREFAKQYLQEFTVEKKLTHGDSSIVLNTTGITVRSEDE